MSANAPAAGGAGPTALALAQVRGSYSRGVIDYFAYAEGATDKDRAHEAGLQAIVDRLASAPDLAARNAALEAVLRKIAAAVDKQSLSEAERLSDIAAMASAALDGNVTTSGDRHA